MPSLKDIAQDKILLAEMEKFFSDHLDQVALEKVYAKEDTHGIADAKLAIKNAFDQLDALFSDEKRKPPLNLSR